VIVEDLLFPAVNVPRLALALAREHTTKPSELDLAVKRLTEKRCQLLQCQNHSCNKRRVLTLTTTHTVTRVSPSHTKARLSMHMFSINALVVMACPSICLTLPLRHWPITIRRSVRRNCHGGSTRSLNMSTSTSLRVDLSGFAIVARRFLRISFY
jgi:hypothetical protein